MKQTLENIAAIHLVNAAVSMENAACSLLDLKTQKARQHAREMAGAAKMARQWALELRKIARVKP